MPTPQGPEAPPLWPENAPQCHFLMPGTSWGRSSHINSTQSPLECATPSLHTQRRIQALPAPPNISHPHLWEPTRKIHLTCLPAGRLLLSAFSPASPVPPGLGSEKGGFSQGRGPLPENTNPWTLTRTTSPLARSHARARTHTHASPQREFTPTDVWCSQAQHTPTPPPNCQGASHNHEPCPPAVSSTTPSQGSEPRGAGPVALLPPVSPGRFQDTPSPEGDNGPTHPRSVLQES